MADVEHAKGMLRVFGIEYRESGNGFYVKRGNNAIDYSMVPMPDEEFCAYVKGIGDARTLFTIKE